MRIHILILIILLVGFLIGVVTAPFLPLKVKEEPMIPLPPIPAVEPPSSEVPSCLPPIPLTFDFKQPKNLKWLPADFRNFAQKNEGIYHQIRKSLFSYLKITIQRLTPEQKLYAEDLAAKMFFKIFPKRPLKLGEVVEIPSSLIEEAVTQAYLTNPDLVIQAGNKFVKLVKEYREEVKKYREDREECQPPEVIEPAVKWYPYENKEYGFKVEYPPQADRFWGKGKILDGEQYEVDFDYQCYSKEKKALQEVVKYITDIPKEGAPITEHTLRVGIAENPSRLSIKEWVQKHEICGRTYLDKFAATPDRIEEERFEDFTLAGIKGVRIKDLGPCPPGSFPIDDKIYLPKNSKVYTLEVSSGGEFLDIPEAIEKCQKEAQELFNQMLSTFEFL